MNKSDLNYNHLAYPFSEDSSSDELLSTLADNPLAITIPTLNSSFRDTATPVLSPVKSPNETDGYDSEYQTDIPAWALESLASETVLKSGYLHKKGEKRKVTQLVFIY